MVTGAYWPELSGGGLQSRTMMKALSAQFRFRVFTTCTDRSLPVNEMVDGIPVTRAYVDVGRPWTKLSAAFATVKFFLATHGTFDVVHLHGFSQKPLVDVQLVRSQEMPPTSLGEADVPPLWSPLLPAPDVGALAPRPRPPDLVRVDQMRGYKDMDAEVTFFRLTSNAGCWWIHF